MPMGIAEVGIPGLAAAPVPAAIPSSCQDDLLSVDGHPLWVTVTGSTATALARRRSPSRCADPTPEGWPSDPGTHTLEAVPGQTSGFDIDQLAFDSAPGGGTVAPASPTTLAAPSVPPSPTVRVVSQSSTSIRLSVEGVAPSAGQAPVNLVLGQSINAGWRASVVGGSALGQPFLIDGFANGWRLDPSSLGPQAVHDGTVTVVLTWQPQGRVDVALIISALAIVACVILVFVPTRRRRRKRGGTAGGQRTPPVWPMGPVSQEEDGGGRPLRRPATGGPSGQRGAPGRGVGGGGHRGGGRWRWRRPSPPLWSVWRPAWPPPWSCWCPGCASSWAWPPSPASWPPASTRPPPRRPSTCSPTARGRSPSRGPADYAWAGVVFLGADGVVDVILRHRRRRAEAAQAPAPTGPRSQMP